MSIAHRRWNGLSMSGIALAAAGLLAAGCGDGSNCIDVVVTVLSPASGAEVTQSDDTGAEDGIQTEVTARLDGPQAGDQATPRIVGSEDTPEPDRPPRRAASPAQPSRLAYPSRLDPPVVFLVHVP